MNDGRTHYEVLDVPVEASPDEIRKRFRELARKFHPDVNRDRPEMHAIFIRINEAYEVLRDPARRASYDLSLRDQSRRQAEQRAGAYGSAPHPGRPSSSFTDDYRSAGPAAGGPAGAPESRGDSRARAEADRERRRQSVTRLLEEATLGYRRGHLREAQRLCQEILQQSRSGPAYELLGDIYYRQERWAEAIENYTLAAQLSPTRYGMIIGKIDRAAGRRARLEQGSAGPRRAVGISVPPANRMSYQLGLSCFGFAVILFLMFFGRELGREMRSERLEVALITHWTWNHLIFMAIDGFLSGAVLAAATWIRPIDEELFDPTVGTARRPLPVGLLVGLLGVIFLPLAVGAYALIAYLQEHVSRSLVLVFVLTGLLTLGFSLAGPDGAGGETFLLGGNVLFFTMLCGWMVGDVFRPSWAMDGS